jgi:hypothetical protein
LLAYGNPVTAATAAGQIHAAVAQVRIGGDYAATALIDDPFSGRSQPFGEAVARVGRLAQLTGIGATYVSDDFLAGVLAHTAALRSEYVGDAPGEAADGSDLRLHALKG